MFITADAVTLGRVGFRVYDTFDDVLCGVRCRGVRVAVLGDRRFEVTIGKRIEVSEGGSVTTRYREMCSVWVPILTITLASYDVMTWYIPSANGVSFCLLAVSCNVLCGRTPKVPPGPVVPVIECGS